MNAPWLRRFRNPLLLGLLLLSLLAWRQLLSRSIAPKTVTYSELVEAVTKDRVESAEFRQQEILAVLRAANGGSVGGDKISEPRATAPNSSRRIIAQRIPHIDETALLQLMQQHKVQIVGKVDKESWWQALLAGVLPFLLIPLLFWWMAGGLSRRGRPMSFGRSKAKLYDRSQENAIKFDEVAGVDEAKAELTEVVAFLKEPAQYRAIGAHIPKGVLLVGPPGTGKTMLARAVAGESGVPFFSMSGSEFVEMFVGVGASRVRDLFEQAKQRAPCIIFIDELDAIGKTRAGAGGFAANEEREQTLNQLLVEMDGFDSGSGLIIMAATNRPEILDRALLRAGRFDRQIVVDRPDLGGREAILKVHAKKVNLGPDIDLKTVAQRTPGMVGADLANSVNEAALASVRRHSQQVEMQDFEEAIDRLQLGLKKEGRVMTEDEKRRVAYHEAGHALAALSVPHADPVHRVTIIPRSIGALGATLQLPTEERYLMTRDELKDQICVLLGGRGAEELICKDVSTGAQNDLERATELAKQMVCRFGMSDKLGAQTFGRSTSLRYLQMPFESSNERDFSEHTAQLIDAEIKALLHTELQRVRHILSDRQSTLETIATELLRRETLQRDELEAIVRAGKAAG